MAKKLIDLTKPENEDEIVERKNALQLARAAKALQKLGERLVSLTERELETIPLTESLRDAVLEAKRLDQKKALYRQNQYIGKLMRSADAPAIEAALLQLGRGIDHDVELADAWRDRLLAEGDAALEQLLAERPDLDRTHLRQLLRQAKKAGGPDSKSARDLQKALRAALRA